MYENVLNPVQVSPSGRTMSLVGSDTIAGSCCTMLDTLHNLVQVLDVPVGQAVAMLSENPARSVSKFVQSRIFSIIKAPVRFAALE